MHIMIQNDQKIKLHNYVVLAEQTHQRWINIETTSDLNVEFRLDLYSDLKVEIHDVVSTLIQR